MTGLKRSDIVLVLFPNSDLVTFKRRPALVVKAVVQAFRISVRPEFSAFVLIDCGRRKSMFGRSALAARFSPAQISKSRCHHWLMLQQQQFRSL
jgi:hypothetical protein